jgi:hypothetical protein
MNNKHFYLPLALLTAFVVLALPADMWAQKKRVMTATGTGLSRNALIFDEALYKSVQWRCIGPFPGRALGGGDGRAGQSPTCSTSAAPAAACGAPPTAGAPGKTSPTAFSAAPSAPWKWRLPTTT